MEITSASSTGSNATEAAAYFPTTALANAVLSDVICQSENPYNVYSMRRIEYAGTYTRVAGGTNSFGTTASGTFTDCTGGEDAFASGGTASGTFLRCVAGGNSFGVYGTASGTFTDCVAGGWSFGTSGTASGTFTNCVAGSNSFGYMGTASGTFTDCVGGDSSFGHDGTASGTFTDCSLGDSDSGFGHNGTASGIFIRCRGYRVARYATVTSTARFTDCHSIDGGYGQWGAAVDAGAVFIRCHGAYTGMNLGTTRLCYDSSNNLIDNSGEVGDIDYAPDSTITVQRGTTDVLSADNLRTAYTAAKALTPGGNALAADNRAVVMIPAGRYDFVLGDVADSNHGLELDAQFVDLVGATGVREDVVLTSAIAIASRGTVEQTADDVKISFLTMEITSASSTGSGATEAAAYFPTTALANAVLSDVICQSENSGVYAMRTYIEYAGTYTRVTGGQQSFAGSAQRAATSLIAWVAHKASATPPQQVEHSLVAWVVAPASAHTAQQAEPLPIAWVVATASATTAQQAEHSLVA